MNIFFALCTTALAHNGLRNPVPSTASVVKKSLVATNVKKGPVDGHHNKRMVDVKALNNELKSLDGHLKDGKYVVPSDTNHHSDASATGDWGNEYGPSPQEVVTAQKKKVTPDTEHVDGKTSTKDHGAEYENPQTETQWKGKVGDTDYYREKSSAASYGTLALAALYFF